MKGQHAPSWLARQGSAFDAWKMASVTRNLTSPGITQTRNSTATIVRAADIGVENRFARAHARGPTASAGGGSDGVAVVRR